MTMRIVIKKKPELTEPICFPLILFSFQQSNNIYPNRHHMLFHRFKKCSCFQ